MCNPANLDGVLDNIKLLGIPQAKAMERFSANVSANVDYNGTKSYLGFSRYLEKNVTMAILFTTFVVFKFVGQKKNGFYQIFKTW